MTHQVIITYLLFLALTSNVLSAQAQNELKYSYAPPSNSITTMRKERFDELVVRSKDLQISNPDSSRALALEALLFRNPLETDEEIQVLNLIGVSYFIQSKYDKALDHYLKGLSLAIKEDNAQLIAFLYNNIGIVNLHTGNYTDAMKHFMKAIDYYSKANYGNTNLNAINNLGMLYAKIENYEKAQIYFDQAVEGYTADRDSIGVSIAFSNKGSMFLKKESPDSALVYLNKSIELLEKSRNKYALSLTYAEVAKTYFFIQDDERALHYYTKSKERAKEIDHLYQKSNALLGLARVYLRNQEYDLALKEATKAKELGNKLSNQKIIYESLDILSQIYEQIGDYESSLVHFRKSVYLKEGILNQSELHQIYNMEIQALSDAKEIQQLEIKRQELLLSRKNATIAFIIVAFLLAMAGLYLLYRNRQYYQLAKHQKDILELTEKKSRAAIDAEIQERKRIGQELHDGLGQMLSVARLNISALQQKQGLSEERKHELMQRAMNSVDQAFIGVRDISHNLSPAVLTEKGLPGALKDLVEQVNKSSQLQVSLETYGLNGTIDNLVENTLYRAVQELLNNAMKHAGAHVLNIQIVKNEGGITLIVEDDGKGFDLNTTICSPGGGLSNLRSRVENLNGDLFIDTVPGRGTIINIVIPIKENNNAKSVNKGAGRR